MKLSELTEKQRISCLWASNYSKIIGGVPGERARGYIPKNYNIPNLEKKLTLHFTESRSTLNSQNFKLFLRTLLQKPEALSFEMFRLKWDKWDNFNIFVLNLSKKCIHMTWYMSICMLLIYIYIAESFIYTLLCYAFFFHFIKKHLAQPAELIHDQWSLILTCGLWGPLRGSAF